MRHKTKYTKRISPVSVTNEQKHKLNELAKHFGCSFTDFIRQIGDGNLVVEKKE